MKPIEIEQDVSGPEVTMEYRKPEVAMDAAFIAEIKGLEAELYDTIQDIVHGVNRRHYHVDFCAGEDGCS